MLLEEWMESGLMLVHTPVSKLRVVLFAAVSSPGHISVVLWARCIQLLLQPAFNRFELSPRMREACGIVKSHLSHPSSAKSKEVVSKRGC